MDHGSKRKTNYKAFFERRGLKSSSPKGEGLKSRNSFRCDFPGEVLPILAKRFSLAICLFFGRFTFLELEFLRPLILRFRTLKMLMGQKINGKQKPLRGIRNIGVPGFGRLDRKLVFHFELCSFVLVSTLRHQAQRS